MNDFQLMINNFVKALNSKQGKNFNLRIKVASGTGIIYQGLYSNVWGRIKEDGSIYIHRQNLEKFFSTHPATMEYFE